MKEIYKTANAQTSFICEAILGQADQAGRVYNKIGLVLVLRDAQNKAVKTLHYYLDIPAAKVLFHDIWTGGLSEEYKEYKNTVKGERGLSVSITEGGGYRILVMNTNETGQRDKLYFIVTKLQARQLAITVLDHLRSYELARALSEYGKKTSNENG